MIKQMNENKEYGGYFSLDFKYLGGDQNELFSEIHENDKLRLNAARYAIVYSVVDGGFSKIHIPVYMCESIKDTIQNYNISYSFYNINNDMEPVLESIGYNECILVCNFFGLKGKEFYNSCISKYKNVIFDNTQCLFVPPILRDNIYNVYSPRKFVGVSDGAYLIKQQIKKTELQKSFSSEYAVFLLKAIEEGTNAAYADYLRSEERISLEGIREMSELTKNILCSFDYENVAKKKNNNFRVLHKLLESLNSLHIECAMDSFPMIYPLLVEDNNLRSILVKNKVYIPQWWKWVLDTQEANAFERKLSKFLLPIPIDHRYSTKDMEFIAEIILGRE